MDIRPVDLPELRAETLSMFRRGGSRMWSGAAAVREIGMSANCLADAAVKASAEGELFYVSCDMLNLAASAAASLPSFCFEPEDLPSPSGLMILGGGGAFDAPGREYEVHGLAWEGSGSAVKAFPLSRTADMFDYVEARRLGLGRTLGLGDVAVFQYGREVEQEGPVHKVLAVFRAAFLLMQQSLAEVTEAESDRATLRRFRRAGTKPKPVRVIELRRPAYSGSGDGTRGFHHQWIVRGHWRQQWYPARQVHRPVWIAPHIKGPEGAPMIGGEKVYAWKR